MQYPINLKMSDGTTKTFWLSDEKLEFGGADNLVTGVSVAGTPLDIVGGVANIPMAVHNTSHGVIKTVGGTGITTNSAGVIVIEQASAANLTARNVTKPVTTQNLDLAVKTALCDGVGAAWSASEQASARARIGLDKDFELLNDYTVSESGLSEIVFDTYSDGTAYSVKDLCIKYSLDMGTTVNRNLWIDMYQNNGNVFQVNVGCGSSAYMRTMYFHKIAGQFLIPTMIASASAYSASTMQMFSERLLPVGNLPIKKITLGTYAAGGDYFPVGGTIKIYGVRA